MTSREQSNVPERLLRPTVPAMDQILGIPFRLLDDGFVRVLDYMGSDESIVQAARVSYGRGTKRVQDDRALIRYLMRHRHTTPFEMCEIKLHIRVPMDCWRQWIRHRTANVNEYSTRYSVAIDSAQSTRSNEWRVQSPTNKQGSAGTLSDDIGEILSNREAELHELSRKIYDERLAAGVAREQARKDLPLSTYTEAYWKIDLHNLLHFLALRMDLHAQHEIRMYATLIGEQIVQAWCPLVWEAFADFRTSAATFSRVEMEILRLLILGQPELAIASAQNAGFLGADGRPQGRNREREEIESKLTQLGLTVPWPARPE
jgi:thymidylate synthase (FAD)